MKKSPCKNCEYRRVHPNCHGTCKDYKDYVQERREYNAKKLEDGKIAEYIKDKQKK